MGEALLRTFGGNARQLKGRYVKDLFKVGAGMEGGRGGDGGMMCALARWPTFGRQVGATMMRGFCLTLIIPCISLPCSAYPRPSCALPISTVVWTFWGTLQAWQEPLASSSLYHPRCRPPLPLLLPPLLPGTLLG